MATVDQQWPLGVSTTMTSSRLNTNQNKPDIQSWSLQKMSVDDALYNVTVLHLPSTASEDELDDQVSLEARKLGILPPPLSPNIDGISSSVSMMTMASDLANQSPVRSQSTTTTSCGSSEHRPATRSSRISIRSPSNTDMTSLALESDNKKDSSIRRGLRKMAGFRKKRSGGLTTSSTLTSISSDAETHNSDEISIDIRSPTSVRSGEGLWSPPAFTATSEHEPPAFMDMEAMKRSMDCKELLDLRIKQSEERARFLEFQTSLLARLRSQRDTLKAQKKREHDEILAERSAKNECAVEDLEARQLEEEMKMEQEHDLEKRAVMLRLRHMEAYCQNPTPPQTPVDSSSGRPSLESVLPERKVTERDYHNLAQQYRERDIMDTLHAAKINVLRGKQKKAVENFIQRKEKELETLEREQKKELALIDREFTSQETDLRLALDKKRARLESRWRIQAFVERTKMEKATGLKYAPLADVVALEDTSTVSKEP